MQTNSYLNFKTANDMRGMQITLMRPVSTEHIRKIVMDGRKMKVLPTSVYRSFDWAELRMLLHETGTGAPPFPAPFMECWAAIYDALHAEVDCGPMFDDLHSVQITPDRRIVITTRSPQGWLREFVEAHIGVVKSALEKSYPSHNVHYRIPRKQEV